MDSFAKRSLQGFFIYLIGMLVTFGYVWHYRMAKWESIERPENQNLRAFASIVAWPVYWAGRLSIQVWAPCPNGK